MHTGLVYNIQAYRKQPNCRFFYEKKANARTTVLFFLGMHYTYEMEPTVKKTSREKSAIWLRAARILAILFAVFISIFALDVFEEGVPIGQILIALFIHLIPTFIILLITWAAWKRPLVGAILFPLLGLFYFRLAQGQDLIAYLLVAGPPFLISLLFLISHLQGKKTSNH